MLKYSAFLVNEADESLRSQYGSSMFDTILNFEHGGRQTCNSSACNRIKRVLARVIQFVGISFCISQLLVGVLRSVLRVISESYTFSSTSPLWGLVCLASRREIYILTNSNWILFNYDNEITCRRYLRWTWAWRWWIRNAGVVGMQGISYRQVLEVLRGTLK